MGFMGSLSSKAPDPQKLYHHDVLGEMNFSEDDEAWSAIFNGLPIFIAYTKQHVPEQVLIEYAISLARNIAWLEAELESQARRYVLEHPSYSGEVDGLVIAMIRVDRHKGINTALIDLTGGRDYRSWRLEFSERICEGMSFDS